MNPKQRRNVIILVVLGLVAGFFVYKGVFSKTEEQRQYEANLAASQSGTPAPSQSTPQPAASGTSPETPTPAAAAPAVPASAFQTSDVDIDELITGIREVDFNYDEVATDVNPMTPLVGPFAPKRVATGEQGETETTPLRQDIQVLVRNLRVTGIMWDKYDPMAVVSFPAQGEMMSEVVARGFEFPDMGVTVHDIEDDRVILNINGVEVPIELEER